MHIENNLHELVTIIKRLCNTNPVPKESRWERDLL